MKWGIAFLVAGSCFAQPSLGGSWQGTLEVPGGGLRLVIHLSGVPGALKGSMDSVDQGSNGIPLSSIALTGDRVTFASEAIHGTYNGKLSADGNAIVGTWNQGRSFPLVLRRMLASDLDGAWSGTLKGGAARLRLVVHIAGTANGLVATLDSPDQGAKGIPVAEVTRSGEKLTLLVTAVMGRFEGTLSADRSSLAGTWNQGAGDIPLTLKRGTETGITPPKRPQTPSRPYPYKVEEITFANPKAPGVTLAGTVSIPQGNGPFPAAVLIHGSGPNDRDESIMGHRLFLVLADHLSRRGVLVLRYDKRGIGESKGDYQNATTMDFASDAEAAVALLKSRPDVNAKKVGLVGHSEGGMIAPLIASRHPDVAFAVMMAGPGVRGDVLLPEQNRLLSEAAGVPPEAAKQAASAIAMMIGLVEKSSDSATLRKHVQEQFGDLGTKMLSALDTPWMRYFFTYDPVPALKLVKCPVLVLNGSKDLQVPAALNLPPIRKAFEEGGNKRVEIVEMPGLNHLFQPAETGGAMEYEKIEVTVAPVVLDKVAQWIGRQ